MKQEIYSTTVICWSLCLHYLTTLIFRKAGDDKRSNTPLTGVSLWTIYKNVIDEKNNSCQSHTHTKLNTRAHAQYSDLSGAT